MADGVVIGAGNATAGHSNVTKQNINHTETPVKSKKPIFDAQGGAHMAALKQNSVFA